MTANPKHKKLLLKIFSDYPFLMPGKFYGAQGRFYCLYIASRRMYSDPEILNFFGKALGQLAKRLPIDAVCGAPTAGVPLAVSVSLQTGIPFLYLRDKRGVKGERKVIEGAYNKNWRIALIDDASGHGQTKKQMVQNIRKEGLICNHIINLFSAEMSLDAYYQRTRLTIHSLIKHSELVRYLIKKRRISIELGEIFRRGFSTEKSNWWQNQATIKDWQNFEKLCQESNYPFYKDHLK